MTCIKLDRNYVGAEISHLFEDPHFRGFVETFSIPPNYLLFDLVISRQRLDCQFISHVIFIT